VISANERQSDNRPELGLAKGCCEGWMASRGKRPRRAEPMAEFLLEFWLRKIPARMQTRWGPGLKRLRRDKMGEMG